MGSQGEGSDRRDQVVEGGVLEDTARCARPHTFDDGLVVVCDPEHEKLSKWNALAQVRHERRPILMRRFKIVEQNVISLYRPRQDCTGVVERANHLYAGLPAQ